MNSEKIITGVVQILMFAISAFALIKVAEAFFKEKSTGASAIKALGERYIELERKTLEKHEELRRQFDELKRHHTDMAEDLGKLENDYKDIIHEMLRSLNPFKK